MSQITPQLVWGLFPRALSLVYFIAIASFYRQILPLAGSRGMHPIKPLLRKIQQDYPSLRRFTYFLSAQFEIHGEESLPSFARTIDDGVWYVVENENR